MKKMFKKYWTVWSMTALNAFQEAFVNRGSNLLFMLGKTIRFTMTLIFLFIIKENVTDFQGYNTDQLVVFFLTYTIVDTIAQIFYRGVYLFSSLVRDGNFDFYLAKPINPLFQALTGKPDVNDALFLIPTIVACAWIISQLSVTLTPVSLILFGILMFNSLLIATSLHIVVLVVGILTTEVDGVIWLYRDMMQLARFPVSVYLEPIRLALFFLIPVGMMITVPAEVLMNATPSYSILVACTVGIGSFIASLWLWKWGLKQYSSASS
ncbi:MAG: ABC-2 family transporter protein [Microgenomates group bacterium]